MMISGQHKSDMFNVMDTPTIENDERNENAKTK